MGACVLMVDGCVTIEQPSYDDGVDGGPEGWEGRGRDGVFGCGGLCGVYLPPRQCAYVRVHSRDGGYFFGAAWLVADWLRDQ